MDLSARLRTVVRRIVGLPSDPSQPPLLMHLGVYRAQVQAASSDGKTLDLQPDDQRVSGHQKVQHLVGVPGLVAVAKANAVAAIGWIGGDKAKARALPLWEVASNIASKLIFYADTIYLGSDSGAQPVPVGNDLLTRIQNLENAYNNHTHTVPGAGTTCVNGSPWTGTATSQTPSSTISNPPSILSTVVNVKK